MGMSNFKREANYAKQEFIRVARWHLDLGVRNLTPAQLRRMRKNHNKRRGSLQSLAAAHQAQIRLYETSTITEATPCPVCGLTGDPKTNPCMTASGAVASRAHKGRAT